MEKEDQEREELQLFKKQERIYPKRVSGKFRNAKWILMVITLAIYYLVPFCNHKSILMIIK